MKKDLVQTSVVILMVLVAAFSRLIPHLPNFTAVGAMAIFAGFLIPNRIISIAIPLLAMWLSDLVINNIVYSSPDFMWLSPGFFWIYAGLFAHTVFAWLFRKPHISGIAGASLAGAVTFFLLSNFGVWSGSAMYEKTSEGLISCYTAALPFFGNMLAGNLIFSAILFGIYFILAKQSQTFRTA